MRNFSKLLLGAASLVSLATAASAQDAPAISLSGAIAAQSDYRFRGISQNDRDPAAQGTLNLSLPEGFYVGTWASMIDWDLYGTNKNPAVEVDIYGGKHFDLGGTDLNVEAYYYAYPDAKVPSGTPKASFFEGIFQLSHAFGPLNVTATYAVSPEFSLGGGTSNYFSGLFSFAVNDWLSISSTIGHQEVELAPASYNHYDIGATASWNGFSFDARYVDTDLSKANCGFYMGTKNACGGGFVGTVTYNIAISP